MIFQDLFQDVTVHEIPTAEQLSQIAISSARVSKLFGFEPKVAFLSHSTFGANANGAIILDSSCAIGIDNN